MKRLWTVPFLVAFLVLGACTQLAPGPTATPTFTPTPTATPIPPPQAGAEVSMSEGPAPLQVEFSDTSLGAVTGWQWDFGDGTSSTEQNPVHEYTKAGTYTASLTVEGPGGKDSAELTDPITVEAGPLAELRVEQETLELTAAQEVRVPATAFDEFGNEKQNIQLTWEVQRPDAGTVEHDIFTASTAAGSYPTALEIRAQEDGEFLRVTLDVLVKPGPLVKVEVAPPDLVLSVQESADLTFKALDEFGNEIDQDGLQATWELSRQIGVLEGSAFTAATRAGEFPEAVQVVVTQGELMVGAKGSITLKPGPVATLEVEPKEALIRMDVGNRQQFSVKAFDRFRNLVENTQVEWTTPDGGNVDQNGTFWSSDLGVFTVIAEVVSGDALVTASARAVVGKGAGVFVKVQYGAGPLSAVTSETPNLYMVRQDGPGDVRPPNIGEGAYYHAPSSSFFVETVEEGVYIMTVSVQAAASEGFLPGDFFIRGNSPVTLDPGTLPVVEMEMIQFIHLFTPFDNEQRQGRETAEGVPIGTLPSGPVVFEWEPVPGAVDYALSILESPNRDGRGGGTSIAPTQTTTETSMLVQLPNPGGKLYGLTIEARDEQGNTIGTLLVRYQTTAWRNMYLFETQ